MTATAGPVDWAQHTAYSDPRRHADLLAAVPTDVDRLSAVARNLIAHYRAQAADLPEATRADVNLRWLADALDVDQQRHGTALDVERPVGERLQGCCRDHTLLCLGVLREHGIPARSRVGFAGYFIEGFHVDHVVVEMREHGRWRRFDPEVAREWGLVADPTDLGDDAGFATAAEVYRAWRAGEIDPDRYGVAPEGDVPRGASFIVGEVIYEVAHRYGDELLLWDDWGAMPGPDEEPTPELLSLLDRVSALLIAADTGDPDAEAELYALYRGDERLRPGTEVLQFSPHGEPPVRVTLR